MTDYSNSEEIVDYILRITREIWEDRNPDLVMRYYGPEARIHALGGIMQVRRELPKTRAPCRPPSPTGW